MKLHDFINTVGTKRIAEKLEVTEVTVKNWRDYDNPPQPLDALKLIKLSHDALTWGDIYQAYCEKQLKKKGVKIEQAGQMEFNF